MTHIKLHHIALDRQALQNIPPNERAMLVYAGHISNELNWFNKIMLALQQTGNEIGDRTVAPTPTQQAQSSGNAMQMFLVSRLDAGKLCEARKFIEDCLLEKAWFEALRPELPEEAREAYLQLVEYLSSTNQNPSKDLLKVTRNKSAFHYSEQMVRASRYCSDYTAELNTYLATDVGNTLYIGSEEVILEGLARRAGYEDSRQFFSEFFDECLRVGRWIKALLGHTLAAIYQKHCGATFSAIGFREEFELEAPPLRQWRLPYFFSGS
jgi:hypothetical protein